jgi:hypothetical protein
MRLLQIAVACISVVLGAGVTRVNVASATPAGVDALAWSPVIPRNIAPGSNGNHHAANPAELVAGFGKPHDLSKSRKNAIRLAQATPAAPASPAAIAPKVPMAEATTGNPSQAPYKWAGLLVVPTPTQQSPKSISMCTAQFITPNVLLTAGHCLKDLPSNPTGPWPDLTKGTFWLQYQNDSGTTFKILCGAANPLWALPSNYNSMTPAQQNAAQIVASQHDFAMILVDGNSPTGVMPYALDWKGKATYAYRIGYPAAILDAAIIQSAPGYVFFADAIPMGQYATPGLVVQWGPITDATNGMGGGAWVVNPDTNDGPNSNILIAVTSFSPLDALNGPMFPGGTFAAYLTAAEFNPLLTSVSNGCK